MGLYTSSDEQRDWKRQKVTFTDWIENGAKSYIRTILTINDIFFRKLGLSVNKLLGFKHWQISTYNAQNSKTRLSEFSSSSPSDSWPQAFYLAQVSFQSVKVGFDSNKLSKVGEEYPIFWLVITHLFVVRFDWNLERLQPLSIPISLQNMVAVNRKAPAI